MKRLALVIFLSCFGFSQNTPMPRSVDKAALEHGVGSAEQALNAYQRTLGKYADLSTVAANAEHDAEPILAGGKGAILLRSRLSKHSSTVDPSEITALVANIDAAAINATRTADSLATDALPGKDRLRKIEAANALTENVRQLRQSSDELRKALETYFQGREPWPGITRQGKSVGPSPPPQPTICPVWGCSLPNFPVGTLPVAVSISPTSASLLAGGTQQFTAKVTFSTNTAVTWSAIPETVSSSGFYTAPGTAGSYTVTATSVADTTKSASATVNVTTSASSTVLLGNPNVESEAGSIPVGQAEAVQATANASGNLQSLVIYLDSTSTVSQLAAGLYADARGHPGALLSQGSSAQVQSGAWNPISLPPTGVVAGTPYWIAILGTVSGTLALRDSNGGCAAETSAEISLTALPAAWITGTISPACPASVFGDSTKVVLFDDFPGKVLSPYWTVISRHGEYSQSETECNIPQQVAVNNGLTITTAAQNWVCGDFHPDGTVWHAPSSWPYITGDVQWTSLNFTYGTVEIRGKFPDQSTSLWPAFWLLGSNCQNTNPFTGETGISTCSNLGSSGYTEIDMTECYGSGWCQFHVANPSFDIGGGCDATYVVDTNWHTFKTAWDSSGITQYMDGVAQTTCGQQLSDPMFLIMQTQTGGVGGTPNNSLLPAELVVNYVKVTQP
ncbi:MAG: family 16 glycosylhydrolase [Terriglobales bacterium]